MRYAPPGRSSAAYPVQLGGLKKLLRKAAGPALAVAAVASGQPQLAVPAFQAGKAATKKKAKGIEAPVEPIQPVGFFDQLVPADRNALVIGGTIVGTLLVSKLLFSGRRR